MHRVFVAVLGLLVLGTAALAAARPAPAAPNGQAAYPAASFSSPRQASIIGTGTGRIAASNDGSANIIANMGQGIVVDSNLTLDGAFSRTTLDDGSVSAGNAAVKHDSTGRILAEWYRSYADGSANIFRGLKGPGGASPWAVAAIPGSDTPASAPYKVTDLATVPGSSRLYVLWARNSVGARLAYSDDGVNWSPVESLPGPVSGTASDFAIGVSKDGVIGVSWFERESTDVLVQMKIGGVWGSVTDIAPIAGQGYGARWAGDLQGGLRIIWNQVDPTTQNQTDVWYRQWTPGVGWNPQIVQLFNTPGTTPGAAYNIAVDPSGLAHIVFSDNVNGGAQQTYYMQGQGTSFSAPQLVVPTFGSATSRYPDIDVNVAGAAIVAHVATNANPSGSFANYYTYAVVGSAVTPTPTATYTPAPTPTPCTAGVFSDVPPGSPFYTWVTDLVSRNAISGYGDCTFRPNTNITRGQVAKVIILAFGLPIDTTGGPHFSDVPTSSPFYPYVETAYHRGIISGYGDGTFRPNTNITRGQLTKMVSIGRSWALVAPATPTFRDVPTSNAFYTFVETAYAKGVISGYGCGGTGEPCPGLYFRPAGNATRGQGAKVIDSAITIPAQPPAP